MGSGRERSRSPSRASQARSRSPSRASQATVVGSIDGQTLQRAEQLRMRDWRAQTAEPVAASIPGAANIPSELAENEHGAFAAAPSVSPVVVVKLPGGLRAHMLGRNRKAVPGSLGALLQRGDGAGGGGGGGGGGSGAGSGLRDGGGRDEPPTPSRGALGEQAARFARGGERNGTFVPVPRVSLTSGAFALPALHKSAGQPEEELALPAEAEAAPAAPTACAASARQRPSAWRARLADVAAAAARRRRRAAAVAASPQGASTAGRFAAARGGLRGGGLGTLVARRGGGRGGRGLLASGVDLPAQIMLLLISRRRVE